MENTERVLSTDSATDSATDNATDNAKDSAKDSTPESDISHIPEEFRSKPSYYIPGTCIDCGTTNICRDYDIHPTNGGCIVSSCDYCWGEGGAR